MTTISLSTLLHIQYGHNYLLPISQIMQSHKKAIPLAAILEIDNYIKSLEKWISIAFQVPEQPHLTQHYL